MKPQFFVCLQVRVTGDLCNLACKYCEYGKATARTIMSDEVLRATVDKALRHNIDTATFCWHGGEPTLGGVDFFQRAVNYQQVYADQGAKSVNSIQTNATLITPEFARLFRDNDFRVGVSVDGPANIHDAMRVDKGGKGTHDKVVEGIRLLREYDVRTSVIATVSKTTLPFPREVFRHLVELGFQSISYSPVFDSPCGEHPSITQEEWYGYIREVFHEWCALDDPDIVVRELDEVIAWISGKAAPCCTSLGTCAHWFVVDHDGSIYPCEKLGRSTHYGNILINDFGDVVSGQLHREFVWIEEQKPEKCQNCEFLKICNNGCRQMRTLDGSFNPLGLYAFCEQRLGLFREIKATFEAVMSS